MFYSFEFLSLDAAALSGSELAKRSDGLFVLTRPKSGGKCQMQTNGAKMRFMLMYRTLNANSSAPNQPNWKLKDRKHHQETKRDTNLTTHPLICGRGFLANTRLHAHNAPDYSCIVMRFSRG